MRFLKTLMCCAGLVSLSLAAQDRLTLNPPELPAANGYSHVVVAPQGRRVVISGQVSLDSHGNLIGKDDFEKQCIQVHENITKALAALGLTFDDVIRTDNYITDRKFGSRGRYQNTCIHTSDSAHHASFDASRNCEVPNLIT